MPTIRTTNRRAKTAPGKRARRLRRYQKALRLGLMYSMGANKFREYAQAQFGGTVTGRMVSPGPNFEYQFPKRLSLAPGQGKTRPVLLTNYAEQERRALQWHREVLEAARARGDEVIEHTHADATIFVKGD